MSMNDKDVTLAGPQGTDIYSGLANPAPFGIGDPKATNNVNDPSSDAFGAGVGPNFNGHRDAARSLKENAGVVEGRPGIIESSRIDPLDPNSSKEEEWANSSDKRSTTFGAGSISSAFESGAAVAQGAAKVAYGTAVGDRSTVEQGKKDLYGEPKSNSGN